MKTLNVALLGLGTVGCGTLEVLSSNADEIARRAGVQIKVVAAAVKSLDKARDCNTAGVELTTDAKALAMRDDIDIVAELIGGDTLAKDLVMLAIDHGKHVVTANKALIALHGNEIFAKANEKGVAVVFEAAVAGGIPIIKTLREGLTANRIQNVAGIINGTSNYILTAMSDFGSDFSEVLAEAQALGYAESDPTFDIEGIDAAHKLTILAALAYGIPLQFDKVMTEGIGHLQTDDIVFADQLGYRIKHLAFAKQTDAGIELRVHPTLIPKSALLASVNGVMNAVEIDADAVGPTIYYGAGAGAKPTASAVVADIVEIARNIELSASDRVPSLAYQQNAVNDLPLVSPEDISTAYYLRLFAVDKPGVLADVTRIFGDANISIEAILQKEPKADDDYVPIILITQTTQEKNIDKALNEVVGLGTVHETFTKIRLEKL